MLEQPKHAATENDETGGDVLCRELYLHWRTLYGRALVLERSRADALDLVQETFERAVRKRHRFAQQSNLLAWLLTIQRRIFTDGARRRQVCRKAHREIFALMPAPRPDGDGDDSAAVADRFTGRDVLAAVHHLPNAYRRPFELFHLHKVDQRRIAAQLGLKVNTVATRLFRARRMIREHLMGRDTPARATLAPPLLSAEGAAASDSTSMLGAVPERFRLQPPEDDRDSGRAGPRHRARPDAAVSRRLGTC